MIAGTASLRSTSLNIVSVFRYEGAAGWRFIAGSSQLHHRLQHQQPGRHRLWRAGRGLYLDGLGTYALWSLLDPAVTQRRLGDHRQRRARSTTQRAVATVGTQLEHRTDRAACCSPPPALAAAHRAGQPAGRGAPGHAHGAVQLDQPDLAEHQQPDPRLRAGAPRGGRRDLDALLAHPARHDATNHTDTTVGVGVTYEYRVRATGLGGASPWSNVVTVTAPATPLDTTPPVVTILTPANGATVSGIGDRIGPGDR